jgi:hypothetical protein
MKPIVSQSVKKLTTFCRKRKFISVHKKSLLPGRAICLGSHKQVGLAVTLWICIVEVLSSIFGWDTACPEWDCSQIFSFPPGKCWDCNRSLFPGHIIIIIIIIIILTAIRLVPGGSVTKIGRTYKKWTYIARKQNIQLTKNTFYYSNTWYLIPFLY